ncbi:hypothetical protein BDD12DRAFT_879133 [Trichophaea hybrida]|nr:hypothetical protein BDD12DRAFT_879133 [Trichophaea hybrida]
MRFSTILTLHHLLLASLSTSLPTNTTSLDNTTITELIFATRNYSASLSPGSSQGMPNPSSTHACFPPSSTNPTYNDMASAALFLWEQHPNKICKQHMQAGRLCTLLVSRGSAEIAICGAYRSTIKCKEAGMLAILHILGFCKHHYAGADRTGGVVYTSEGFQLMHY